MSKEAMKLALEALENSIDLVSQEARNAEQLYGKYPTRLARIQGLVAFEVAHEKVITALREALAEQPAQQQKPVEYLYRVDVSRRKNNECTTYDHPIYFHSQADASNYCWAVNRTDWPKNTIVIAESAAIKIAPQPAQRTWVGLSPADRGKCLSAGDAHGWIGVMEATEARLKELNT